jgi:hypothetical protein
MALRANVGLLQQTLQEIQIESFCSCYSLDLKCPQTPMSLVFRVVLLGGGKTFERRGLVDLLFIGGISKWSVEPWSLPLHLPLTS